MHFPGRQLPRIPNHLVNNQPLQTEEDISREGVKKFLQIPGEARGVHFKTDASFILKKKGVEGLRLVQEKLRELDCPLDYNRIETLKFYPLGWRIISLLTIKKVLNLEKSELKEIGGLSPYYSFIIRLYVKFFYSIPKILEKAPKIWSEYFTVGRLVVKEYDEKKRSALLRIEDFSLHPLYCTVFEGYFESMTRMVTNSKEVVCKETECFFKGGKAHEFFIKY